MNERTQSQSQFIFPVGTQVVTLSDLEGNHGRIMHPRGAVGVVVKSPSDWQHSYRVRFVDGLEHSFKSYQLTTLAKFKAGQIADSAITLQRHDLYDHVVFQCIIGSQAYGLADDQSDVDRRGVYLPPAEMHWSLYGVPDQLECHETQESYWELQKFIVLALKANPNVLECLYSPLVEKTTAIGDQLLSQRSIFLSRLVYQTYNGYVMSQFKKMQADIRNQGQVKWKHVMHLIRLLISGITVLREGFVTVAVADKHKEKLVLIKHGQMPWEETEKWRRQLHRQFEDAQKQSVLPERPDYDAANELLIHARRAAAQL